MSGVTRTILKQWKHQNKMANHAIGTRLNMFGKRIVKIVML